MDLSPPNTNNSTICIMFINFFGVSTFFIKMEVILAKKVKSSFLQRKKCTFQITALPCLIWFHHSKQLQTDIDLEQAQKGSFQQLFEFLRCIKDFIKWEFFTATCRISFHWFFSYFEILLTSDWAIWSGHRHWVNLEIGGLPFMSVSECGEIFKNSIGTQFSLDEAFGKIWRGQIRKPCLASDDILAMKWPLSWVSFTSRDLFQGILNAVFVLCTWRRSVAKTDTY